MSIECQDKKYWRLKKLNRILELLVEKSFLTFPSVLSTKDDRGARYGVRGTGCEVRVAAFGLRGTRCVVRGAGHALRGAEIGLEQSAGA